jgi:molybdenum cofactor guanylyltransferase
MSINESDPRIRSEITGTILAGGRGTRMGGEDKGLLRIGERTMVEHVIRALRPQVSDLFINANRNLEQYRAFGLTVVTDFIDGYCGPLAGVASAMKVARTPWLLVVPCDSPFICASLARRLHTAAIAENAEIAVARSTPDQLEPVFALIQRALLPALLDYLQAGDRKVDRWYAQHLMTTVEFSDFPAMFLNVNTPDQVRAANMQIQATTP